MTVGRHGRLTYKKGTMDLSKLLDDQLLPRSADGKETMLVTGKLGTKYLVQWTYCCQYLQTNKCETSYEILPSHA